MMEFINIKPTQGLIACCECGTPIPPNPSNMCMGCVRSRVDITANIPKQSQLTSCRNCERYLVPPNGWTHAKLESKELMSLCIKRLKPSMTQVKLIEAVFIWTEPHSKRIKVKLTVQQEVFVGAILQQSFVVEFVICNQMCEECHRSEASDYWRACVQVRQKCDFKKTLFHMEQMLLKHNAHSAATNVKPGPTGIDFFFPKLQDARKFVDFLMTQLPCKYHYSQQLVTHDAKSNVFDYKHTFCVELVPITNHSLVCLSKKTAQSLGNLNQFVICIRVTNLILLLDPTTLKLSEVTSMAYWKDPFVILCEPKTLVEFFVLEAEEVDDVKQMGNGGNFSTKHRLADVWVTRSNQVGQPDAQTYHCRTHLGRILNPGDTVMGYDISNSNVNNSTFDSISKDRIPDVVLIKKVYDPNLYPKKRNADGDTIMTEDVDELDLEEEMETKMNLNI